MTKDVNAESTPKGVVAVFVAADGRQVCAVSDFDQSGYGGFTLQEAQTIRVKDRIAYEVSERFCSSEFTKHLETYQKQEVVQRMQRNGGYKLHIIPIGHDPHPKS